MGNTNDGFFNLKALMSANHITIHTLSAHMGVTQKRIRSIRNKEVNVGGLVRADYRQAIQEIAAGAA
jgi:hypothetical protein